MNYIKLLDCTLRDGGYYNAWDFNRALIEEYLRTMAAISADFIELGFRGFPQERFCGGCAYTTDYFIQGLPIPKGLNIGVMVNASELVNYPEGVETALGQLFAPATESPVSLVRIACHFHQVEPILAGVNWLKKQGYQVGVNLMQIADCSSEEIKQLAKLASQSPLDVLYFADSMGSMNPEQTSDIIGILRQGWSGELGIHTHDNMGQALANSLQAVQEGVTWIDGTVLGMGRGAGNVKTEYLAIELDSFRPERPCNITNLMGLIRQYFVPMQQKYGWGTNTYYYLAGKYGIHPTYIQEMLSNVRYDEEDILAVIDRLKQAGGKKFKSNTLEAARNFYVGEPIGTWLPASMLSGREVLLLGTGPGVSRHQTALEDYIRQKQPVVIALNTQSDINSELIDLRAACHPVRLLADCHDHLALPQPLITPASMLPDDICEELKEKKLLDFGLGVQAETFSFAEHYCVLPTSMVVAYTLAIATSGKASQILLAGFDGYGSDDPRNQEMDTLLKQYRQAAPEISLTAITPSMYQIPQSSLYAVL